jgi:AAA domain
VTPRLWEPSELAAALGVGRTTASATTGNAATRAVAGQLSERVGTALAVNTGDRSTDTARVIAACVHEGMTVEQAHAVVMSRSDLAERLTERTDDDVVRMYLKVLSPLQEQQAINRELMTMLPEKASRLAGGLVSSSVSIERPGTDGWTPIDLSGTLDGLLSGAMTRPVPTVGLRGDGAGLFYTGKVNGVAGASGSGKSWAALLACAQAIASGQDAMYIDYESDAAETLGRLLDLGTDPAAITARFHYIQPDLRLSADGAVALTDRVRSKGATVVVIDSVGESMAVEGDKPNDDDDTARWFRRLPTMLAGLGPAVVVIDHVTRPTTASRVCGPSGVSASGPRSPGRSTCSGSASPSPRVSPAARGSSAPRIAAATTGRASTLPRSP